MEGGQKRGHKRGRSPSPSNLEGGGVLEDLGNAFRAGKAKAMGAAMRVRDKVSGVSIGGTVDTVLDKVGATEDELRERLTGTEDAPRKGLIHSGLDLVGNTVKRVGNAARRVTSGAIDIVGRAAGEVVGTVRGTADRVLRHRSASKPVPEVSDVEGGRKKRRVVRRRRTSKAMAMAGGAVEGGKRGRSRKPAKHARSRSRSASR